MLKQDGKWYFLQTGGQEKDEDEQREILPLRNISVLTSRVEKYIFTRTNYSHHCIQMRAPSNEMLALIQIRPGRDLNQKCPSSQWFFSAFFTR